MSLSLFKSQKLQDRMESIEVEPTPGLTKFEALFCLYYVQGARAGAAYLQAASNDKEKWCDKTNAAKRAYKLLKQETIAEHIAKLTAIMETQGIITAQELQFFLTDAILTPLSDIDEHSPLCKSKKVEKRFDKNGNVVSETTTYEKVDPMKAADMMLRVKGLYSPVKVDMRHSGGVMVVPATSNLDDWQATAQDSQAALMADAIDV